MQAKRLWMVSVVVCLSFAFPAWAGPAKGGDTTPAIITFRDCQGGFPSAAFIGLHPGTPCPVLDDRIKSDTGLDYQDGVENVEAFIGSAANFGNVWLKLKNSTRGLFLDFTDCASPLAECKPPFASQVVLANIKVHANDVKQDGLFGMVIGESISAPMRVYYWLSADQPPGFVDFNPNQAGKSLCKNKGSFVTVTRTGNATWEVLADPSTIACVTLPGGAEFGGTYRMPFQFTVQKK